MQHYCTLRRISDTSFSSTMALPPHDTLHRHNVSNSFSSTSPLLPHQRLDPAIHHSPISSLLSPPRSGIRSLQGLPYELLSNIVTLAISLPSRSPSPGPPSPRAPKPSPTSTTPPFPIAAPSSSAPKPSHRHRAPSDQHHRRRHDSD